MIRSVRKRYGRLLARRVTFSLAGVTALGISAAIGIGITTGVLAALLTPAFIVPALFAGFFIALGMRFFIAAPAAVPAEEVPQDAVPGLALPEEMTPLAVPGAIGKGASLADAEAILKKQRSAGELHPVSRSERPRIGEAFKRLDWMLDQWGHDEEAFKQNLRGRIEQLREREIQQKVPKEQRLFSEFSPADIDSMVESVPGILSEIRMAILNQHLSREDLNADVFRAVTESPEDYLLSVPYGGRLALADVFLDPAFEAYLPEIIFHELYTRISPELKEGLTQEESYQEHKRRYQLVQTVLFGNYYKETFTEKYGRPLNLENPLKPLLRAVISLNLAQGIDKSEINSILGRIEEWFSYDKQVEFHIGEEGLPFEVGHFGDRIIIRNISGIAKAGAEYLRGFERDLKVALRAPIKINDLLAKTGDEIRKQFDKVKLYVFDWDGTLAEDNWQTGNPVTAAQLTDLMQLAKQARARGGRFVLLTSRPLESEDIAGLRPLLNKSLESLDQEALAQFKDAEFIVYQRDGTAAFRMTYDSAKNEFAAEPIKALNYSFGESVDTLVRTLSDLSGVSPVKSDGKLTVSFQHGKTKDVYKIMDQVKARLLEAGVQHGVDYRISFGWKSKRDQTVDLFIKVTDKGYALERLAKEFGVESSNQVLFVGDGFKTNDKWALAYAGAQVIETPKDEVDAAFGLIRALTGREAAPEIAKSEFPVVQKDLAGFLRNTLYRGMTGISGRLYDVVGQILISRGIDTEAKAEEFFNLDGKLPLSDYNDLPDMKDATKMIHKAIESGKKIVVFGDYDADGITATAILVRAMHKILEKKGIAPSEFDKYVGYRLPDRFKEGYGMSEKAIRELAENGCRFIITVDNGVSAGRLVKIAQEAGMEVVVTDHHA
ncbi:MAG TPA: DHH family phosphoesterase, partial [bacterium]|nr:DHH family phosphoesterase [bacterium]